VVVSSKRGGFGNFHRARYRAQPQDSYSQSWFCSARREYPSEPAPVNPAAVTVDGVVAHQDAPKTVGA